MSDVEAHFYTVCPANRTSFGFGEVLSPEAFRRELGAHARWADDNGFYGMVFYNFASALDPFAAASVVMAETRHLRPLIAVQPGLTSPYATMKMLASLSYLHDRKIDLNVVTGFNAAELARHGDEADAFARVERLREFLEIVEQLSYGASRYDGRYFKTSDLEVSPPLAPQHRPSILVPGGTYAPLARVIVDHAHSSLSMARPRAALQAALAPFRSPEAGLRHAIIVGIVARDTAAEAWDVARAVHGKNGRDRLAARMMIAQTGSAQHKQILALAGDGEVHDEILWYGAARAGIDCPKLVGSYTDVAEALGAYRAIGVTDFIVDLPASLDEYDHILRAVTAFRDPKGAVAA